MAEIRIRSFSCLISTIFPLTSCKIGRCTRKSLSQLFSISPFMFVFILAENTCVRIQPLQLQQFFLSNTYRYSKTVFALCLQSPPLLIKFDYFKNQRYHPPLSTIQLAEEAQCLSDISTFPLQNLSLIGTRMSLLTRYSSIDSIISCACAVLQKPNGGLHSYLPHSKRLKEPNNIGSQGVTCFTKMIRSESNFLKISSHFDQY